jgi:hypothetical protein
MKLRVKKSFRPCEAEPGDELFRNGIFVFNVTKLSVFLKANTKDFPIENVVVETLGFTSDQLDESTVLKANLASPIILAEIAPGRFNIIDGNHRVERARRDGVTALPAYRVGFAHHHGRGGSHRKGFGNNAGNLAERDSGSHRYP